MGPLFSRYLALAITLEDVLVELAKEEHLPLIAHCPGKGWCVIAQDLADFKPTDEGMGVSYEADDHEWQASPRSAMLNFLRLEGL